MRKNIETVVKRRIHSLPSVQEIQDVFTYDSVSGAIHWKVDRGRRRNIKAGEKAGYFRKDGYLTLNYNGRFLLGHRVAWVIMTGEWPNGIIDHIDRDPSNNRWTNLREVNAKESASNRNNETRVKLGRMKGVRERKSRFIAHITIDGKSKHIGSFDTPEAAHFAYLQAADARDGVSI